MRSGASRMRLGPEGMMRSTCLRGDTRLKLSLAGTSSSQPRAKALNPSSRRPSRLDDEAGLAEGPKGLPPAAFSKQSTRRLGMPCGRSTEERMWLCLATVLSGPAPDGLSALFSSARDLSSACEQKSKSTLARLGMKRSADLDASKARGERGDDDEAAAEEEEEEEDDEDEEDELDEE